MRRRLGGGSCFSSAAGPAGWGARCLADSGQVDHGIARGALGLGDRVAVGTRLTLKGRYALVKLQCIQVGTCRGSLSLATTGLPKSQKASAAKTTQTKLGSARFSIPALQTRTVKVKLSRTLSKRLAALSARRLKRLKIVATATVGAKTTKFSLGATRTR